MNDVLLAIIVISHNDINVTKIVKLKTTKYLFLH